MNEPSETTLFPSETEFDNHRARPEIHAEAEQETPIEAPASPAETTPAIPTQSLEPHEALRQRLAEAPAPLLLKDLTKGLTPKGKKAPAPPDFPALLIEEAKAGRLHQYPSGAKGAERYWSKDEKKVIQEAVLAAANEPKKLGDLQKVAKEATGADKAFVETTLNELIEQKHLHHQSNSAKPLYAKEKPRSLDKTAIADAILAAAETPKKITDLVKAAKQGTGAEKPLAESIIQEMIQSQQLHAQSSASAPLYGKNPPPDLREPVIAALKNTATKPDAEAKLIAKAQKATGAEKSFVELLFKEMIEGKQLHKHKLGAKELYGSDEPPHPLEVDAGKKAFDAFVKAGIKLIETVHVPLDEVLQRLRKALEHRPSPNEGQHPAQSVSQPSVKPPEPPASVSPRLPGESSEKLASESTRRALKAAYEELCLDVEFQDKVVELRRLFHEAKKALPTLTLQQFHHELEQLQQNRIVELQALNEVQKAKEPELALHRGDRLLYFVIWR